MSRWRRNDEDGVVVGADAGASARTAASGTPSTIMKKTITRCFILCMESPFEKVSRQVFNAGSDTMNFTIAQLAAIICTSIPGVKIEQVSNGDKRNYCVSFTKVRERLGFTCEKRIEDSVLEFKQLYEANQIGDYRDRGYSNHEFLRSWQAESGDRTPTINLPITATLRSLSQVSGITTEARNG